MKTTYEQALFVFGTLNQAIKANEELNELGIELVRYALKDSRFDRLKVLEELVDVEIMLKQLKLIFNFTEGELLEMKCRKIAKLQLAVDDALDKSMRCKDGETVHTRGV